MSGPLILFVGAIYVVVGFDLFRKGDIGMAIVFIAYAVANFGMYLAVK